MQLNYAQLIQAGMKRLNRFGQYIGAGLALIAGLHLPPFTIGLPGPDAPSEGDWSNLVQQAVEMAVKEKHGGVAASLVVNGEIVASHAAGIANSENNVPMRPNTPVDIASCAKQFTAACLVLLAQKGDISLDDDVRRHYDGLRIQIPLTIRHLLTHTSGLQDFSELQLLARGREGASDFSTHDTFRLIDRQTTLAFTPGTRALYSNSNYVLAARIVESVSGMSIGDFARQNLFAPLGMDSTWYNDGTRSLNSVAIGHGTSGETIAVQDRPILGAGGVVSTAEDLGRWLVELQTHKHFGDHFWDEMTTVGRLDDGTKLSEALGLMRGTAGEYEWIEHAGRSGGTLSLTTTWPEVAVSYAILTTNQSISPYQVADGFRREVISNRSELLNWVPKQAENTSDPDEPHNITLSARPSIEDFGPSGPILADYIGLYPADLPVGSNTPPSGGVGVSVVRLDEDSLVVDDPRGVTFELTPVGRDVFQLKYPSIDFEILVIFTRNAAGIVDGWTSWSATDPSVLPAPTQKCPQQSLDLLQRYTGQYQCPDLINAVPVRLVMNDAGSLEFVWGINENSAPAHVLADGRVTVYTSKMQCALVPTIGTNGRVDSLKYEGHRVSGVHFERIR